MQRTIIKANFIQMSVKSNMCIHNIVILVMQPFVIHFFVWIGLEPLSENSKSLGWFFRYCELWPEVDAASSLQPFHQIQTRGVSGRCFGGIYVYRLNGPCHLCILICYYVSALVWWKLVSIGEGGGVGRGCRSKHCSWTHPDILSPVSQCQCMFVESLGFLSLMCM